ncbi:MAG: hypothetical protein WB767_14455, partial [Nocardioides sp.]
MTSAPGPRLLDSLSLASEVADGLLLATVRDTHLAWADRVNDVATRVVGPSAALPGAVHRGIAGAVYAGLGAGLRATSVVLDKAAEQGIGPDLEAGPRGRFVS